MADKTLSLLKSWGQTIAFVLTMAFTLGTVWAKFQEYDKRITTVERLSQTVNRIDANLQMTMKQLKIEPIMGKDNE